jgi:hypothetical protein
MKAFRVSFYVFFMALFAAYPALAAEELIGEWLLDSPDTGGVFPDSSGYGYDAVVNGASYDSGYGGFYFDGVADDADGADYLDIANAVYPYDFTKDFRITLDVATSAAGSSPFFSRRAGSGWQSGDWFMALNNGVITGNGYGVGAYGPGTTIINDFFWHSIDMWYVSDTDTIYCNVDGKEVNEFETTPFKNGTPDNSGHIWIGNHSNYQFFEGWIKNVRVYRVVNVAYNPSPEINSFGNAAGTQTLSWNSPDEAVTWYDVYISTDEGLVDNRDASVKVASYTTQNSIDYTLLGDKTYYWAVDCFHDPDLEDEVTEQVLWQGLSGDTWNFTTVGNYAVNLTPATGSEDLSIFTKFGWNVDIEADSYNVYIANSQAELDTVAPVDYAAAGTEISFDPGTLELHRTYYWKLGVVRDGSEYFSSVRWFRTGGLETLEDFNAYATAADVREVWTCPVYQTNELDVGPEFSRYSLIVPFGTSDVTYSRSYETSLDFTGIPAIAFEFLYKSASQGGNPESFNFKLQDEAGGVIVEKTVDSVDDFITPEGGSIEGSWHWVYISLADAANIDQVKKMTITVPGQSFTGDLRIDNIALRVPYCSGDIPGDVYGDCVIDIRDFAIMAENWLECNRIPAESCFTYFFQADVE